MRGKISQQMNRSNLKLVNNGINLSGLSSQSIHKQNWDNLDKGRHLPTFLGRKTVTGTREREYPVCVQASQQQPFQIRLFVRIFLPSIFALARNGSPKNEADMWWKLYQKKWTSCCHRETLDSPWRHSASTAFRSAAWSCAYLLLASSFQGSTRVAKTCRPCRPDHIINMCQKDT